MESSIKSQEEKARRVILATHDSIREWNEARDKEQRGQAGTTAIAPNSEVHNSTVSRLPSCARECVGGGGGGAAGQGEQLNAPPAEVVRRGALQGQAVRSPDGAAAGTSALGGVAEAQGGVATPTDCVGQPDVVTEVVD